MNKFLSKKWFKRYLDIARNVALWSKDPNKKIGSIIVNENGNIVSQGYNGFPRNIKDDDRYNDKNIKNIYVVHAEVNAILNALYNGASVKDCSIFISGLPPCHECTKIIIQSGIKNVIFDTLLNKESSWYQSNLNALKMLDEAHLSCFYVNDNVYKVFNFNNQDYYILQKDQI